MKTCKTKSLPSIRITEETHEKIKMAIKKYNEKNIISITEQEFRRLSYEYVSQLILKEKLLHL
jgi:hypothetical protein